MRPWNAWLYGLGLSGILAFGAAGCGGGDVPDPSADELAAADEAGGGPMEPTAPAAPPAPAAAAEPIAAAPAGPTPTPDTPPTPPGASAPGSPPPGPSSSPSPTPDAATATAAEAQPVAVKSDTAELLSLATGAASPTAPPAEPGANPAGGPGAPGAEMGAEPGAGDLMAPPGSGIAGPGGPGFPPGPGMRGGEDGSSGIPGSLGLGGNASGPNEPGDTNSPHGAVKAFLYALKQKDRTRLAEATALRASTVEEGGKYRELFARILDESISDSELDDLASKLEGFTDAGDNQVKSTGRQGVTIRKTQKDGGWIQRTVTLRREKKGWGVLDITGPTEFDNMRVRNQRRR